MHLVKNFVLKYKFEILISAILISLYFLTRFYRIMSLPIFTDEAIYVRWSQIAKQDASWRFISLTDGKQPMFVWIAMNLMRFVKDPLLASRLVSVFAGFFSMIGLFLLGREIFKNRFIGFISSMLYLVFPFALVYDRMALYDSLVGMFAVWSLYFEIILVRKLKPDMSFVLGMILGGGILTKTSGFFSIYLIPFTLLLFDFSKQKLTIRFLRWVVLFALSVALAYAYYSVLRLSPFFYIINEKNTLFVYSFKEWLIHPFTYLYSNFSGLWNWFITYMTWPVFLLVILSFIINFKFLREKLPLLIWFLVPFVALVFFGKTLYPRFIFFMTLFLLPLAAFSIYEIYTKIKIKLASIVIILAFLVLFVRSDYYILNDFARAPIADPDLGQYINDWPAGGGLKEVINYLDKESKTGKIYVASLGTFGSDPTLSVEIYLGKNKNINKRGIYPVPSVIPFDLLEKAKYMPVYLIVSNQKEFEDQLKTWPLEQVLKIRKGEGNVFTWLYKIKTS